MVQRRCLIILSPAKLLDELALTQDGRLDPGRGLGFGCQEADGTHNNFPNKFPNIHPISAPHRMEHPYARATLNLVAWVNLPKFCLASPICYSFGKACISTLLFIGLKANMCLGLVFIFPRSRLLHAYWMK